MQESQTAKKKCVVKGSVKMIGDTLVIPYSNIINMNLHFIELPEGFDDPDESEEIEISRFPPLSLHSLF